MIYNYIMIYTLSSNNYIIFVIKIILTYMPSKDNKKRVVNISRKPQKEENNSEQIRNNSSPTGGIVLASAIDSEKDPLKVELEQKGYIILSENEYGVIARKSKGKPTFLARTSKGYFENEKPNSLLLPESINTAMKIHAVNKGINAQQYIVQLIMKDLKENNLL